MVDLVLLGLLIALEPLPVIGFILVIGTIHGRRNGWSFIAAWFACLIAIVAATLALSGGKPPATQSSPALATAVATVVVGLVLVYVAWRLNRLPPDRPRKEPAWVKKVDQMSARGAAVLGVLLQPWPLVAAGVTIVIEADLAKAASFGALVLFCLLATASILTMQIYMMVSHDAATEKLTRLRGWLERHRDRGIVLIALSVGAWLVAKGIYLIISGKA